MCGRRGADGCVHYRRLSGAVKPARAWLPHLATPAEEERLRQFERLVAAPESASDVDGEALAAGWRRWWRERRADRIAEMAERLPPDLVEGDRRLASFVVPARQAGEAGRR